jgi:hypothetical protein
MIIFHKNHSLKYFRKMPYRHFLFHPQTQYEIVQRTRLVNIRSNLFQLRQMGKFQLSCLYPNNSSVRQRADAFIRRFNILLSGIRTLYLAHNYLRASEFDLESIEN